MKAAFRSLVILSILVAPLAALEDGVQLPAEIREAVNASAYSPRIPTIFQLATDLILLIPGVGAVAGLMLFRNWGRLCYLSLLMVLLIRMFSQPFWVSSGTHSCMAFISAVLHGVTLTMSYLPPLSASFKRDARLAESSTSQISQV